MKGSKQKYIVNTETDPSISEISLINTPFQMRVNNKQFSICNGVYWLYIRKRIKSYAYINIHKNKFQVDQLAKYKKSSQTL